MTASVVEVDPAAWVARLDGLFGQVVAPFFFRREPRLRARAYLLGLLSGLERKNGWSLAEFAGESTPDGMQRLLNAAVWDADHVRDALRRQVARQIGSADGVLAVDDTGFEKAGRRSAGVQRQYTGTAGKITNCQIGVFLSYVDPGRHRVLIDRELYLPRSWFAAPDRLTDAAVPNGTSQRRNHANTDRYSVGDDELIPLTVNEIRRLHALAHPPRHPWDHHLHWSRWRRRHQYRARRCHYQRQRNRDH